MSTTEHAVSRWPFRMALVLACATFPLIWVGGLVTTYDAGMAVPDWPSTYGYNLFLYPWETWLFGPFDLFIEHGHRLLGAVVGMLTIGLLAVVFRADSRAWMKFVALAALVAVIGQGVLGGFRVRMDARQLAMLHGCFGPAFFALTATIVLLTSRWWRQTTRERSLAELRLQPLAFMVLVIAYAQLVVGALLRHTPVDATYGYFRGAVFFHLILAAALLGHSVWLAKLLRRASAAAAMPARLSKFLVFFVGLQIVLGLSSWVVKYGWPDWAAQWSWNADYTVRTNTLLQSITVTAHVANGSLILATAAMLLASVCRQSGLAMGEWQASNDRHESADAKTPNGSHSYRAAASGSGGLSMEAGL